MSNVNKVILLGRVGSTPEVKHFDGGGSVIKFPLATTESWKNKQGEKQSKTSWHNVVFGGPIVEVISKYVNKGDLLFVEGTINYRDYEKDGNKVYFTEIKGSNIQLMPKPQSSERQEANQAAAQSHKPAPAPEVNDGDDLPF